MKVSKDLANCEAPTRCSSKEKTERLGSCGEIVDSATMIARDSRAARMARSLQNDQMVRCQAYDIPAHDKELLPICHTRLLSNKVRGHQIKGHLLWQVESKC